MNQTGQNQIFIPVPAKAIADLLDWSADFSSLLSSAVVGDNEAFPDISPLADRFQDLLIQNPELLVPVVSLFSNSKNKNDTDSKHLPPTQITLLSRIPNFLIASQKSPLKPYFPERNKSADEMDSSTNSRPSSPFSNARQLLNAFTSIVDRLQISSEPAAESVRTGLLAMEDDSAGTNSGTGAAWDCAVKQAKHWIKKQLAKRTDWEKVAESDQGISVSLIENGSDGGKKSLQAKALKAICSGLNQQLDFQRRLRTEKLNITKDLVYGASHEINNPLANIASRAQRLMSLEEDAEKKKLAAVINAQAFRGFDMLSGMMFYANPPKANIQPGNVLDCWTRAKVSVLKRIQSLEQQAEIHLTTDSLDWATKQFPIDSQQLEALAACLIQNAIEASSSQEVPKKVSVHLCEMTENKFREDFNAPFGEVTFHANGGERCWLVFSVSDFGQGRGDLELGQMFHPYFSGREAGRGHGFGLVKVLRITQMHHGQLFWLDHQKVAAKTNGCTCIVAIPAS